MILRIAITFLLLFSIQCIKAQELQREWLTQYSANSNQTFNWLLTDAHDDIYFFGREYNLALSTGFLTIKFSKDGVFLWDASFNNWLPDQIRDCEMISTGPIVGGTEKYGNPDNSFGTWSKIIHYDADGTVIWDKYLFGDTQDYGVFINAMEVSDEDDIFAFGNYRYSPELEELSAYINKIDPITGEAIWSRTYYDSTATNNLAIDGKILDDKLVALLLNNIDGQTIYYLKQLDLNGTDIMTSDFSLPVGYADFSFDEEGNCIFGRFDISKVNLEGITEWNVNFVEGDTTNMDGEVEELILDATGNVYACGKVRNFTDSIFHSKVLALSSNGEKLWSYISNTKSTGEQITINNDYVFLGSSNYIDEPSYLYYANITMLNKNNGIFLSSHDIQTNEFDKVTKLHTNQDTVYVASYSFEPGADNEYINVTKILVDNIVKTTDIYNSEIGLNPNPTSNYFFLSIPDLSEIDELSIFNVSGQKMLSFPIYSNNQKIDISSLASGVYFVQLLAGNTALNKKIVVSN